MMAREQIESILKINGVPPGSPDEQIRSVLLSARFSKDEVDTAIMVLRENIHSKKTRVEGLHKIFRTDDALRPEEISELLGIEVNVEQNVSPEEKNRELSKVQFMLVLIFSITLAIAGILFYMYLHKIGIFHPSSTLSMHR